MQGLAMLGKRKIGGRVIGIQKVVGEGTKLEAGPWRNAATDGKCKGQSPRAQPKVGKGREYIQRDKVFITMYAVEVSICNCVFTSCGPRMEGVSFICYCSPWSRGLVVYQHTLFSYKALCGFREYFYKTRVLGTRDQGIPPPS